MTMTMTALGQYGAREGAVEGDDIGSAGLSMSEMKGRGGNMGREQGAMILARGGEGAGLRMGAGGGGGD